MILKLFLLILIKTNTRDMKKIKATKIQYNVFRKLFSKKSRIRKRRDFLNEVLEDIQTACGYSPQQVSDIVYLISRDITFNPFLGVTIENFRKYSHGFQSNLDKNIDCIVISLDRASLGIFDFLKRDEKYKVKYYHNQELILSVHRVARRF